MPSQNQHLRRRLWQVFPARVKVLSIAPWLYAIIALLVALGAIVVVIQDAEKTVSHVTVYHHVGLILKGPRGLEVYNPSLHGPRSVDTSDASVGIFEMEIPDSRSARVRGAIRTGRRIRLSLTINGVPVDYDTAMLLLPELEVIARSKVGEFLYRDGQTGDFLFNHPDDPWRIVWWGLAWDALVAFPLLVFLWLIGWQVAVLTEARRFKRLENGTCPRCRYDIRNLTEPRCPECGERW